MKRTAAALIGAALTFAGVAAAAADAPAPAGAARPRIGLALSGGGARGIAHVGVLKVLDELRIPISCVTGTSMGAIVGATFAAGTPPARLQELVLEANWSEIFRDQPPRAEISIRRKGEDFKTLFAPEFGVQDGGLALPKGLIAGVSIEAFFRVLTQPAAGITDFHKLPIPFVAMATDIENGASIVLDHGSLAQAIRASMSVPGAIAPVEIDGRLLVDGGIANNLPIDEARKLCADVIIAINISTPPLERKDITSALSVTLQLINFLGKHTVERQLASLGPDDVLIAPDLGTISAASFTRSVAAIRIGEEATRQLAPKLARYSLPEAEYAALRDRQVAKSAELGTVAEIRFEGLERTNPEVLRGLVHSQPGEPLTEEKVSADLRRIFGRGDFEGVSYRIIGDTGPRAMVISPREKSWGPAFLRFGLGLQSDFQGDNSFNLLVQYRKTWINHLGGELLVEGQVGQDTHLYGEFYQPLHEPGVWFMTPYAAVGRTTRGVYAGDDRVADYLVGSTRAGVDLGATLGTMGAARVGLQWTRVDARVDTGSPVLPSVREDTAGVRAALVLDQLDQPWFSREGYGAYSTLYAATKGLGSAVDYQVFAAEGRVVHSWGPHTVSLTASGGTDFGSDMPAYESFTLGGPLRLSAFRVNQFAGREYAFARAMYYQRIFALPELLGSGVFAGASAEVGTMRDRFDGLPSAGTLFSGSVFLGASTFAGPAYFGAGIGNSGTFSLYLLLGAP
ncbi:MAG: patatin-like phospholipase family protein [Betaproteobacteria bacterium]|nr:patatin-like phospholipase family protein [Betaproteobacteria bacterium]